MKHTKISLHTQFQIGQVDPRIFGGFLEHMGRAVYQGVYDPKSSYADKDGFRSDVLDALRGLDYPLMRYPGGNFVSGYHWQDGIGPPDQRPTVRELAWQSIEPNQVGTDEYIQLCRKMNWDPMITVNLGTGTPEEARNWVEYCNAPIGTRYADLRAINGSERPHDVKLWCLGNEMDGEWQLGHVPADQYAIRAQQAAKMMKDTDSSIEMVACGSSAIHMPDYLEWDRQVLEHLGDLADYISLHRYVGNPEDDTLDFLAITNSIDQQIEEVDALCRYVQGKRRSKKRTYLCFDEWNVWYRTFSPEFTDGHGKFAPHLIEESYTLEDALVVAGFLNSFIRHADVLKIANLAQIVNVIAPILTDGDNLLLQSIYYPLAMYAKRRHGMSLQPQVDGPSYEAKTHGQAAYVDASAILDADQLQLFMTNRCLDEQMMVRVHIADRQIVGLDSAEILSGPDPKATNTFERPDTVQSHPFEAVRIDDGKAVVTLPSLSAAALTLRLDT
jgi:alpha-N-arabinofuranosidase